MTTQFRAPGAPAVRLSISSAGIRRTLATMLVMVSLAIPSVAQVPDLTAGGVPTTTKNLNLGPTGAHGWLYHVSVDSSESRQILVQSVAAGSPADGILAPGDVILGVDGTGANPVNFTSDARIALGMAIGDAEARNPATLKVLRWRNGVTTTETLTLQTMGAYSATAPYNCPKSALILEQGLEEVMANQDAGTFSLNTLTLLAANDPSNPQNAARQARAQTEALAMMLTQEEIDERLAGFVSTESKVGWNRGHRLLVLAEYYLHTGDSQVLPSIEAMAMEVCNGMSLLGTHGHQFTNPVWNGGFNGPYNIGYGVINSAGLPSYFGLLLAKKCGITHPELDSKIARATNFFAGYAGYGTIPYGEHEPVRDFHESNGKSGLTALAMSVAGGRPEAAKYFSKMASASASEREIGHCGSFFNYLWAPLGANVGGEEAAASHFSRIAWRLDLNRRWDGGFDYDCWYHYTTGGPQYPGVNQFWASTPMLLTYAMPLRQLTITGKDQDPSLYLSTAEVNQAAFADTYDATIRTTAELVVDLGLWSTKVQGLAAQELAARAAEHATVIPQLIAIATNTSAGEQRVGACFALGKIGNGSAAADLAVLLTDSDERVRWAAAYAMRYMPKADQLTHLNTILAAAAITGRAFDPLNDTTPLQFANSQLGYLLFYSGTASGPKGVIEGNQLNGVDRTLLYPAIEALSATPLGHARGCLTNTLINLTQSDVEAVASTIVDVVKYPAPADKMFKDSVRVAGLEALQTYNIAEGVALAGDLVLDYNFGDKNSALDTLALYAGSSTLVNPDPNIPGICEYLVYAKPYQAVDAQEVLNAIVADTSPVAPTPFKSIQSVTARNPSLQLPTTFTELDVDAYDHAQGDSIYTWRKVHGAGKVTFVPNKTGSAKNTTVVFEGIPGQYLFEVIMSDSRGLTEEVATVAVTLNDTGGGLPTNNPPTATAQSPTIPMSTPTPIILSGTDPEGLDLNFAITSGPSNGKLSGTAPHFVYSPDIGYTGADSFTFEVTDSEGQTDSAVVSLSVDTNPVLQTAVYEPFDYPVGVLAGQSGTTEVGLDGTWHAQAGKTTVVAGSLTFGNLATAGNSFDTSIGANWGAARAINSSALSGSGLLNDGSTIWMSAVVGYAPGGNYTNANLRVALANNRFHDWTSPQFIVNDGSQIGSGVGFSMYRHDGINGRVVATQFRDQASLVNNNASIFGTWEDDGAVIEQGSYKLIVCRITWASDPLQPDLIEIFQPLNNDLALPSAPISVLSAVLDQSTYDTLAFNVGDKVILDEIRIGSNYHSVLAGTEPLVADVTAPTPNPVGFLTPPTAVGNTAVAMEAVPAYDPNGVEYYFTCTAGGGNDSGWQASTSYTDSGLTPGVQYSYTVTVRDLSPAQNATIPSAAASVTLPTSLTIPDVSGMVQSSAESLIQTRYFTVGSVTTIYDNLVPMGAVVSQTPVGGSSAAAGTAVDLVVSLGSGNNAPVFSVDPIVAGNATAGALYGGTIAGTATDLDPDAILSYSKLNGPAWLSVATDGTLSGTPGTTDAGINVFSVKVVDENGLSDTAALQITVDAGSGIVLLGGFAGVNNGNTPYQSPSIGGITVTLASTLAGGTVQDGTSQIDNTTWGTAALDVQPPTIANALDPNRKAIIQEGTLTPWTLTLTVTNGGTDDLVLDQVHYDIKKDVNNEGPAAGTLTYASGDLTDSPGASAAFSIPNGVTANDLSLGGFLTDTTLAPGESATFTWAHGTPQNPAGNTTLRLDNFAISGSVSVNPSDNVTPTLAGTDIIDDQGGSNVTENDPVTYTVIFSEDMDAATVDASDFSNAGSAPVTIGSVTETSPGVFSVEVTPTGTGSLQLQVNAGAVLNDAAGNTLDTTAAIADDTVITVDETNVAPAWTSNPVDEVDATEDALYAATLADDASDGNSSNTLEFAKVSGPAWLSVASNGSLSGTPTNADLGPNVFTVSVTDNVVATPVEATLNITVNSINGPAPTVIPLTSFDPATFFSSGITAGIDFDVDSNGASGFQATTQAGFLSVPAGGAGGDYNVSHNGITFDINTTNNNLGGQHRWRGNAVAGDLMNDFEQFFGRSATTGNGVTSVVTLSGLTPNADYEVSFFCYNVGAGQGPLSFHHGTTTSDPLITTFTPTGNQNNYSTWVPGITFGMNSGASGTIAVTIYAPEYASGLNWDSRLTLNGISLVDPSAPANSAPVWATNPVNETDASEDAAYSATLADNASDADPGDFLAFAKVSGPEWLTVAVDGTLSGTPDNANVGSNVFTVSADDGTNPAVLTTLNINVLNTNDAPVFTANPIAGADATEDLFYSETLVGIATDDDSGAVLEYAKVSGPAWLSVELDGTISGTPGNADVGLNAFTVSVTDGIVTTPVEATLNIEVLNTNDAPVWVANPISGANANEDEPYGGTLAASASDADAGTNLSFGKVDGPAWLSVAPDGTLSGTPDNADVGANVFTVSVTDNIAAPVTTTLDITVLNTNDAPVFTADPITGGDATTDVAYSGTLDGSAIDDDDDTQQYAKVSGPEWLSVAPDGALSGTPGVTDAGANVFTVSVTDGNSPPVEATLNINVNQPFAVLSMVDNQAGGTVFETQAFAYAVTFNQAINPATLDAADFANGTGPALSVNSIAATSDPAVFMVHVTPGGAGVLTLQIAAGAVIENLTGTALDTTSAISDDTTLAVDAGSGPVRGSITVDASASWSSSSSMVSGTLDASGSDKLVVIVTGEHGFPGNLGGNCSGVTYDGVPLIQVVDRSPIGGTPIDQTFNDIWYLDNPPTSTGTIVATVASRGSVTAFALSGTAPGAGQTSVSPQASKSVVLSTSAANSIVIASHGMGGDGNTANVANVDAVAPLTESSAPSNGSWDGHVTAHAMVASSGTATYAFTGGSLVGSHTIAAEFLAAEGNSAPEWNSNPVVATDASEDGVYASTLANDATDAESDPLSFAKVSGPEWLNIATDGTLSGTPGYADVGSNTFTVSVTDNNTPAVEATVNIEVIQTSTLVPDVTGISQSTAESSLAAATLTVGAVTQEYSSTVPAGDVISQGLGAGSRVPMNSSVDLVVSLGIDPSPKLVRTTVSAVSNTGWTTVSLGNTYNSPVIVATPIYPPGVTVPVATRITNVTSTGFDLKIDRADGLTAAVSIDVSIVVVDEGVYTQAADGVKMEAVKYTSTVTARKGSWVAEARSFQNSYTDPVVVGQVMSANDPAWSVFWSMGSSSSNPVNATNLNVGKHVGEDPNNTRADETIGYIVIESGSGTVSGVAYEAALGGDTVRGFGDSSNPYTYNLSGNLTSASSAAASVSGMDGVDGSWAVLSGSPALTTTTIGLHACEDLLGDSEQKHTHTQVGYIVFE